jgi:hypothetical protein
VYEIARRRQDFDLRRTKPDSSPVAFKYKSGRAARSVEAHGKGERRYGYIPIRPYKIEIQITTGDESGTKLQFGQSRRARMALALGKLTTGTPKFRGSGFVGMHVKPITAQEKFNFPRIQFPSIILSS